MMGMDGNGRKKIGASGLWTVPTGHLAQATAADCQSNSLKANDPWLADQPRIVTRNVL
jgi:hypothetical protein